MANALRADWVPVLLLSTVGVIISTLVVGLAMWGVGTLLALPIGIAAAIYLEEYAPDNRLTRIVNTTVRNLAGVPDDEDNCESASNALFMAGVSVRTCSARWTFSDRIEGVLPPCARTPTATRDRARPTAEPD